MKKTILVITACLITFCQTFAQRIDHKLEKELYNVTKGFKGTVGIYVHDMNKNKTAYLNADTIFPTASMIKIPIAIAIMDKIEKGQLQFHQGMIYKDSLLYAGVDLLGSFKSNEKIELSKLLMLMLSMSDNTASLWLQSLAGGGIRINQIQDSLGMKITRVNSRTEGRQANQQEYGWGQTSPREMSTLMEKIVNSSMINESASNRLLRLLGRNYWDEDAISQIPPDVFVASKSGAVDQTRNEVLFVNGKHCRYIFCICTKNNQDQSWTENNEAWVMTRKLSKLLWDYYK